MTSCDCKTPDECRYGKRGKGFDICRGVALVNGKPMSEAKRQAYRATWEHQLTNPLPPSIEISRTLCGESSPVPEPERVPRSRYGGVGTELSEILNTIGITYASCQCRQHALEMDERGIPWCETNIETIVGWLKYEAKKRNWPVWSDKLAAMVVRRAIAEAKAHGADVPFTLGGTRHLLYHMWPVADNDAWRWNVAELLKRFWLFNGRRIVGIVTDSTTVDVDEVRALFPSDTEFLVTENKPNLREVVTFVPMLERVELDRYRSDTTFFGHAKGITRDTRRWTEIMYETCLDYYPLVFQLLQHYPTVGSFKHYGRAFTGESVSKWHYSGTFYWFRNADVFARNWRGIEEKWFGAESWPGVMFDARDAGTLFHGASKLNLYEEAYMTKRVEPELKRWKEQHAAYRLTR